MAVLYTIGYLFMIGVAAFIRAAIVPPPEKYMSSGKVTTLEWDYRYINATFCAFLWPVTLPVTLGHTGGLLARKVYKLLHEEPTP